MDEAYERLLGGYQKALQQKSSLTFTCESPTMSIQLKSPTLAPQKTFRQGLHFCYTMSYDQTSFEKYLYTPAIIFSLFILFRGSILFLTSVW